VDEILAALVVAGALTAYASGAWRAHRRRRPLPRARLAAFAAGWLCLAVALLPPLGELAHRSLSLHMAQHEILMLLAAPLLVLGRPDVALALALPRAQRRRLRRLRPPRVGMGVATALHAAAVWAWHLPAPYQWALESAGAHALQHASFAGTAALFWWSVLIAPRARAGYGAAAAWTFATALHTSLLGALLLLAPRPWYPRYAGVPSPLGLGALEEQQLAGVVMWVPGGTLLAAAALLLVGVPAGGDRPSLNLLVMALVLALALEGALLFAELAGAHPNVDVARAARLLTRGGLRVRFWGGAVVAGIALPIVLAFTPAVLLGAVLALAGLWIYEDAWIKAGQSIPLS